MCSAPAVPSEAAEFAAAVRVVLTPEQVHGAPASFAVDGAAPSAAVEPEGVEQVQLVLREAQNARVAVISIGGGTQLGYGNLPGRYDVALSMRSLDRLIAYEPADMTVVVEPGMRLEDLQRRLAEHGQWLPIDPPVATGATIGGLLATNAFGPGRHAHGTLRDWLIGARVVLADGTTSKSGGRVVKNVTGYDLHKLHVGALGSLGVIVEAAFKVTPLAKVQRSAAIASASASAAFEVTRAIEGAGLATRAIEVLSPASAHSVLADRRWHVLLRAASSSAAVERTMRDAARIAADASSHLVDCDDDAWERWARAFAAREVALRISTPVEHAAQVCEALEREQPTAVISATASCGLIRAVIGQANDAQALAAIARTAALANAHRGSLILEAASPAVKQQIDVFGAPRGDFEIMRRLKGEFDPRRTLSPGRFLGRL